VLKNVRLILMIGPVVPLPVPRDVVEALESVEVTHNTDAPSGFQLTFSFSSKSTLNTILLLLPRMGPAVSVVRVIVVAVVNGSPSVLMDGMLTHQQVSPDVVSGRSKLTLTTSSSRACRSRPCPRRPVCCSSWPNTPCSGSSQW
jgi:hypothetical protein